MRATVAPVGRGGAAHQAVMIVGGERLDCVIGAAGVAARKVEGDQATPAGILPIRRILYRADRVRPPVSGAKLPREPIAPDDLWCDDPTHAAYNRPFLAASLASTGNMLPHFERLWRDDALYDVIAVLGWNDAPVEARRGSAIFLHAAPRSGGPTEGCIGIEAGILARLLAAGLGEIEIMPMPIGA